MPTEKQPERGVKSPYQARYGLTIGECRGVRLEEDAGSISDEELIDATNVRVHDGILLSRFGQDSPTNDPALAGCVQGLVDIDGLSTRCLLAKTAEPAGIFSAVSWFDEGVGTEIVGGVLLDGVPFAGQNLTQNTREDVDPRQAYFWWDGRAVFGGRTDSDAAGKLWEFVVPDEDPASQAQTRELFPLLVPGELVEFQINTMCSLPTAGDAQAGEALYFGTMGGGVVAYVNGELVRLLAEATLSERVFVFEYNNRLYAAGADELRVQDGWAGGSSQVSASWSVVTVPGSAAGLVPMCVMEWNGLGWIGGQIPGAPNVGAILKIDDSSGAPVVSDESAGLPVNTRSVDEFAVGLDNKMFIAFVEAGVVARVWEWDGSTTVTLPLDYGGEAQAIVPRMRGTKDRIFIIGYGNDSPNGLYSWDGSTEETLFEFGPSTGTLAWYDLLLI